MQQQHQQQQDHDMGPLHDDQLVQANHNQPLIGLQIVDQPPEKAVYKRNVKPNPSVQLVGEHMGVREGELFVVPILLRCDTYLRSKVIIWNLFFSFGFTFYFILFLFYSIFLIYIQVQLM